MLLVHSEGLRQRGCMHPYSSYEPALLGLKNGSTCSKHSLPPLRQVSSAAGLMATGLSLNQDLFGQRHCTLFALNSTVLLEGCELALKWSLPIYVKNLHPMCMPDAYACDLSRHVT